MALRVVVQSKLLGIAHQAHQIMTSCSTRRVYGLHVLVHVKYYGIVAIVRWVHTNTSILHNADIAQGSDVQRYLNKFHYRLCLSSHVHAAQRDPLTDHKRLYRRLYRSGTFQLIVEMPRLKATAVQNACICLQQGSHYSRDRCLGSAVMHTIAYPAITHVG